MVECHTRGGGLNTIFQRGGDYVETFVTQFLIKIAVVYVNVKHHFYVLFSMLAQVRLVSEHLTSCYRPLSSGNICDVKDKLPT